MLDKEHSIREVGLGLVGMCLRTPSMFYFVNLISREGGPRRLAVIGGWMCLIPVKVRILVLLLWSSKSLWNDEVALKRDQSNRLPNVCRGRSITCFDRKIHTMAMVRV